MGKSKSGAMQMTKLSIALLITIASGLYLAYRALVQDPYFSQKTYCPQDPIPRNVATIPWIGCFILSAGHNAAGTFSNQRVEVTVEATGREVFRVNGTVVTQSHGQTNIPYVRVGGVAGYSICPNDAGSGPCPSSINI